MAVIVPIILAQITSAKVSAGRMQAANSMDQALFSLFGHYYAPLAKEYGLLFLNAGGNGAGPDLEAVISSLEDSMDYVLEPNKGFSVLTGKNLLNLKREAMALTAFTLATDAGGAPFRAQAIRCMKDTAGLEAVSLLQEELSAGKDAEENGKEPLNDSDSVSYGDIEDMAAVLVLGAVEIVEPQLQAVAEVGIINGLSVGQDWQAAPITVLVRYAETETSASSPTSSAQLDITKYTVSASATDGTVATNYASAPAGVTVTLTASADPHCQFVADSISAAAGGNPVTLAQSGTTATFTMPQANVTATAAFERDKFALTYSVSGEHGIIASVKDSAGADIESGELLEWGTGVTISFSPETNYVVKTLTVNGTDKASSVLNNKYDFEMLPDNTYINAEFGKAKFALTLNAGSNGSLSASPSGDIEWGTSVTVTIKPNANYVLDTFTYDGTPTTVTNNKYTFTMPTKAITVSATFKEDLVFDTRDTGVVVVYNKNNTGAAAYNYVTASHWNANKTKYQNAGWKAVGVAFYNYYEGVEHPNSTKTPGPENIGDQKWYMIAFDKKLSENDWTEASNWANTYEKEGLTGWNLPEMMYPPEVYDSNPKPSKKMDQVITKRLDTINSTLQTLGETQIPVEVYWSREIVNNSHAGNFNLLNNVSHDNRSGGRITWSYPKVLLVHVLP